MCYLHGHAVSPSSLIIYTLWMLWQRATPKKTCATPHSHTTFGIRTETLLKPDEQQHTNTARSQCSLGRVYTRPFHGQVSEWFSVFFLFYRCVSPGENFAWVFRAIQSCSQLRSRLGFAVLNVVNAVFVGVSKRNSKDLQGFGTKRYERRIW